MVCIFLPGMLISFCYKHVIITGLYKAELSNPHSYKLLWHRVLRQCIPGASILLQKEDEQQEKGVFSSAGAESHMPGLALDMEEHSGWEECAGACLLLSAGSGGPGSAGSCSGLNSCSHTRADPPADQRDGTVQCNRRWTSALQPTPWFMGFAWGVSLSSGDNPSLLQVSLQAHPFLSAPPHWGNLNAWLWAALAALNETQAKSLLRSFSLMPPGLMWGALWKMERTFKWPFLLADVHGTRQCVQEPNIANGSMHKHCRQIRPSAFVMARALLVNFVIWQTIFPSVQCLDADWSSVASISVCAFTCGFTSARHLPFFPPRQITFMWSGLLLTVWSVYTSFIRTNHQSQTPRRRGWPWRPLSKLFWITEAINYCVEFGKLAPWEQRGCSQMDQPQ